MKALVLIITLSAALFFAAGTAAAADLTNSTLPVKQAAKFYILPIEDIKSSKSNSFQLVVFRSIYNFMRIIPSVDVPEDNLMNDLFWLSPVLAKWDRIKQETAPKQVYDADYILYGDYDVKQKDPEKVVIRIGVWSKADNKNVFTKSYETATDIEIFDSIDLILKNVIEDVLKIDYSLGRLDFDIKAGSEKYEIFINNKLIDAADKKDYRKSMSVLGGQTYTINIVRPRDGRTVYSQTKVLGAKENFQITYFATGSVIIDPVRYALWGQKFIYTVDGRQAFENEEFTNMNALSNHNIIVVDEHTNLIYMSSFNVVDGLTTHVTPEEKWGGPLHVKLDLPGLGIGYGGLAVEYFPLRYFWLEAGGDIGWYNVPELSATLYDIMPRLDIGYYFFGDMAADFRAGAGITGSYYIYFSQSAINQINPAYLNQINSSAYSGSGPVSAYDYSAGLFAVAEWKWFSLRAGASYDFGARSFFPVAVLSLKL